MYVVHVLGSYKICEHIQNNSTSSNEYISDIFDVCMKWAMES